MGVVGINVMQDEDVFVVVAGCDWIASTEVKRNSVGEFGCWFN